MNRSIRKYWAKFSSGLFQHSRSVRAAALRYRAVIVTGSVGLLLTAGLSVALGTATSRGDDLAANLDRVQGNYDSVKAAWNDQNDTISGLRGINAEAASREEALAKAEAELVSRSEDLDARDAAITSAETTAAANTFAGDGIFIVGADVQPGQYRSEGGRNCYWARLNLNGDDIIDNNLGDGPSVLTIQPGDGLIETSNCAPFTKTG